MHILASYLLFEVSLKTAKRWTDGFFIRPGVCSQNQRWDGLEQILKVLQAETKSSPYFHICADE